MSWHQQAKRSRATQRGVIVVIKIDFAAFAQSTPIGVADLQVFFGVVGLYGVGLGLRWADVDLDAKTLTVANNRADGVVRGTCGGDRGVDRTQGRQPDDAALYPLADRGAEGRWGEFGSSHSNIINVTTS
jgi:hypothetical protein